jgi:lipid II:glycine glycyltransferase (peptidoglycan interpeptide bridge formation enzyme)
MGAGKPDDGGYGVRDFKLKFGGELVELGRYIHVCNRLLFAVGKYGVKIMKKL